MNLQEEQLKITISLGLMSFFTVLILGFSQIKTESNFIITLIKTIIYGVYTVSLVSLFLFVIFTGAKLKSREPGIIHEIPIGEKFRNFLYDEGIEITFGGIFFVFFYFLFSKLSQILNFLNNKFFTYFFAVVLTIFCFVVIDRILYKVMKN